MLDKVLDMVSLLALMAERKSDTRLIGSGGRLLLHCTTNIMEYNSRRFPTTSNSTSSDKEKEVYSYQRLFGFLKLVALSSDKFSKLIPLPSPLS